MMLQVTTPQGGAAGSVKGGKSPEATANSNMMEVLENTLWNRTLGSMSEEIVAALVCQIFEGEPGVKVLIGEHGWRAG